MKIYQHQFDAIEDAIRDLEDELYDAECGDAEGDHPDVIREKIETLNRELAEMERACDL